MLFGDTMRGGLPAQKRLVFTNLGLAAWLIVSAWLIPVPLAAAWMLTAAGLFLIAFTGYNAFLIRQGLPPSRGTSAMVQLVAIGVLLVPAAQPLSPLAMANAIVVASILFALSGVSWTGITPTKTVAARGAR